MYFQNRYFGGWLSPYVSTIYEWRRAVLNTEKIVSFLVLYCIGIILHIYYTIHTNYTLGLKSSTLTTCPVIMVPYEYNTRFRLTKRNHLSVLAESESNGKAVKTCIAVLWYPLLSNEYLIVFCIIIEVMISHVFQFGSFYCSLEQNVVSYILWKWTRQTATWGMCFKTLYNEITRGALETFWGLKMYGFRENNTIIIRQAWLTWFSCPRQGILYILFLFCFEGFAMRSWKR